MSQLRIKDFCSLSLGKTPKTSVAKYWNNPYVNWITPTDFNKTSMFIGESSRKISKEALVEFKSTIDVGDVVLTTRAPIGNIAIAQEFATCNQGCKALSANKNHDNKYLYFAIQSQKELLDSLGRGTTFQELSSTELSNVVLNMPSLSEQIKIGNKLSNDSRNVNESIALLKQKLLHLEEYKTALIHNAVTKGLDANGCRILDGTPAADMNWKPSGVEWIGNVSDEWGVESIKSLVSSFGEGGTPSTSNSDYWEGGDIPWVIVSDICEEISGTKKMITEKGLIGSSANLWPVGTVILSNAATIGSVGITKVPLCTKQGISGFIVNPDVDNYFFSQCLVNKKDRFNKMARETTFKSLNGVFLKNEVIALPLNKEQKVISEFIANKNQYIEASKQSITQKINLLVEYKKSLINEAVSGKVL
jgi:type I restriction enzyme S subunit